MEKVLATKEQIEDFLSERKEKLNLESSDVTCPYCKEEFKTFKHKIQDGWILKGIELISETINYESNFTEKIYRCNSCGITFKIIFNKDYLLNTDEIDEFVLNFINEN